MTGSSQLIKRLRATTHEADPYALMAEAADALVDLEAKLADALVDLEAKLANAERRAEDAESRNDFLLSEIDEIIKRERQKS